jgi:hypothetical protein
MTTMNEQSSAAADIAPTSTALLVGPPIAIVEVDTPDAIRTNAGLSLRDIISRTLDDVDEIADAIAHALGLRDR